MPRIFSLSLFFVALSASVSLAQPGQAPTATKAGANAGSRLIATVAGQPIKYSDIQVLPEKIIKVYERVQKLSGENKPPLTPSQVSQRQREEELDNFQTRVTELMQPILFKKFGISVSDAEAKQELKKLSFDAEKAAARAHEEFSAYVKGLKAVYSGRLSEQQAYNTYVARKTMASLAEWQGYVELCRVPGRLEGLETMTHVTAEQLMAGSIISIRQQLLPKKLGARVDTTLAKSDPQFARSLKVVNAGIPFDPIHGHKEFDSAQKYIAAKRHAFWLDAEKPYVTVVAPDFKGTL